MATQTTAQAKRFLQVNGVDYDGVESPAANAIGSFDEDVADSQTDFQVNLAIDVSAVKWFWIKSDQDITLETNDGSTPDDTINLLADKAYMFVVNDYNSFLLTTDVTAFFFTNSSGSSANVKCAFGYDPTP